MDLRTHAVQAAIIAGAATVLGLGHLALRPELSFIAEEPPPASCAPAEPPPLPAVARMTTGELRERLGQAGVTIVDARPTEAFETAHIPGAISLPADQADAILGVQSIPIPADGLVVTYCDQSRCEFSESLGLKLEQRIGCQDVRVLEGGWAQWLTDGGPTASGPEGADGA